MERTHLPVLLGTGLLLACTAGAQTITFDDLAPGTTLGTQYASLGVTFAANAFSGPGSSSSGMPWATNTDMTVVSTDTGELGVDYGALGTPSLVSGNILHHFLNWEGEDGDPSFNILLDHAASSVSVTFAGVGGQSAAPDTRIFVYSGSALVAIRAGSLPDDNVGQLTLAYGGNDITRVAVAPGSFDDWVGVDDVVITPAVTAVPEPETWALTLLGLATFAWSRRRLHP